MFELRTIHNEYAQENNRINRQDRQKITFPGSAYLKEISQQYTPATHTEAVHCQGVFLTTEGSWIAKTSRQLADASTPISLHSWVVPKLGGFRGVLDGIDIYHGPCQTCMCASISDANKD